MLAICRIRYRRPGRAWNAYSVMSGLSRRSLWTLTAPGASQVVTKAIPQLPRPPGGAHHIAPSTAGSGSPGVDVSRSRTVPGCDSGSTVARTPTSHAAVTSSVISCSARVGSERDANVRISTLAIAPSPAKQKRESSSPVEKSYRCST
jgi:hypothetical protein